MAAKKLPIEDQVLKLLGDGLGDNEVAEKVGTTPNHVWAIRAASGVRPVSERQLTIARAIVQRKRAAEPARKMAATPDRKRPRSLASVAARRRARNPARRRRGSVVSDVPLAFR